MPHNLPHEILPHSQIRQSSPLNSSFDDQRLIKFRCQSKNQERSTEEEAKNAKIDKELKKENFLRQNSSCEICSSRKIDQWLYEHKAEALM